MKSSRTTRARYVVWDFDGTLAQRKGGWSGAVAEVAAQQGYCSADESERFRPYLASGFPWHSPSVVREAPANAETWWKSVYPVLANAYRCALGVDASVAVQLTERAQRAYVAPDAWRLMPNALDVVDRLATQGWRHVVLSNHTPELESLLKSLGLRTRMDAVFNSALTGCEKPHPRAFANVQSALPLGAYLVMVGDNPVGDYDGAVAAGWSAVLIAASQPGGRVTCTELTELPGMLMTPRAGARPE